MRRVKRKEEAGQRNLFTEGGGNSATDETNPESQKAKARP